MPKGSKVPTGVRGEAAEKSLFLACFYFDEPGDEEHTGSFQIVVEAPNPDRAIEICRTKLRKVRIKEDLFDNPVTIYLQGVVKLAGSFKDGVLVNYVYCMAPSAPAGTITSLVPEENVHDIESYHATNEEAEREDASDEGETIVPFVDFGGTKFRRALEAAKNPPRTRHVSEPHSFGSTPFRGVKTEPESTVRPVYPGTKPRSSAQTEQDAAREESKRKKERRQALADTLAELRSSNKKRLKGARAESSK